MATHVKKRSAQGFALITVVLISTIVLGTLAVGISFAVLSTKDGAARDLRATQARLIAESGISSFPYIYTPKNYPPDCRSTTAAPTLPPYTSSTTPYFANLTQAYTTVNPNDKQIYRYYLCTYAHNNPNSLYNLLSTIDVILTVKCVGVIYAANGIVVSQKYIVQDFDLRATTPKAIVGMWRGTSL